MVGTPVAQTRGMTDKALLAACRRRGLVVDEDFEAGISPAQRPDAARRRPGDADAGECVAADRSVGRMMSGNFERALWSNPS